MILRVRPFTTTEIATGSNISCISVEEGGNVIIRNPGTGAAKQYQFSSVLNDKVSQKELFDTTISPFMASFFSGVPSLILAYGVTAAGKTYTINGTNSQPGIIPRITDVILKTLNRHKPEKYRLAKGGLPGANIFQTLTHERIQQQQQLQQTSVKVPPSLLSSIGSSSSSSSSSGGDLNYSCSDFSVSLASSTASSIFSDAAFRNGIKDDACEDVGDEKIAEYEKLLDKDYDCSLFLSYLEIYNENVYDLLAETSSTGFSSSASNPNGKREGLTIVKDHIKGHTIVRGLRQVPITNYAEAQQAIELGFKNRSCTDTNLNRESSRSHAMLTFTLVQYPHGRDLQLLEHEASTLVRYSRISIVDLAGSERLERTNNTGIKVTQASNINNSLLTFRICVNKLRENQRNPKSERPVPFRSSKLTRLFQDYLAGSGRAMMIVNISPKAADYAETSHVIDFGSIAKTVSTTLRTGPSSLSSAKRRAEGAGGAWTSEKEEGYNKLLEQVKSLNQKLERIERDHLLAELDIRNEIADEYKAQIVSRDAMHHKNFADQLARIETLFEARLESMALTCERVQSATEAKVTELTGELVKTRKDYEDALNEVNIERAKNTKESADFASSLQKIIAEYKEKNKTLLQEIEALKTGFQKTSAEERAKIIAQCEADIKAVREEVQAAAKKETDQLKADMQREEKEHAEDRQNLQEKITLLQEQLRTIQAKQTAEALTQSGRIIKKVLENSVCLGDNISEDEGDESSSDNEHDEMEEEEEEEEVMAEVEEHADEEEEEEVEENEEENDDNNSDEEKEKVDNKMYEIREKDEDYVYYNDNDGDDDELGIGNNDDDDDDDYEALSASRRGKRKKETAKNNKKMFSKLLGQVSPKRVPKNKRTLSDSQESDKEIRGLKTPVPLTASPLTPSPQNGGGVNNNDNDQDANEADNDDAIVEELPKKVVNVSRRRRRGKMYEVKELSMKQDIQQTPMKLRSGRRINNK